MSLAQPHLMICKQLAYLSTDYDFFYLDRRIGGVQFRKRKSLSCTAITEKFQWHIEPSKGFGKREYSIFESISKEEIGMMEFFLFGRKIAVRFRYLYSGEVFIFRAKGIFPFVIYQWENSEGDVFCESDKIGFWNREGKITMNPESLSRYDLEVFSVLSVYLMRVMRYRKRKSSRW